MTNHNLTPNQLAEQAGNSVGHSAIKAMQMCPTFRARLEIFMDALNDVSTPSPGQQGALKGFAVAMLATLDRGMGID